MIKRLKLRFIIVNMSILTCVLISILVSIFIMMYSSEVKISYELMESIIDQKKFGVNKPMPEAFISDKDTVNLSFNNNLKDNRPDNFENDNKYDFPDDRNFPHEYPERPDDRFPPDEFDPNQSPVPSSPASPSQTTAVKQTEKTVKTTAAAAEKNKVFSDENVITDNNANRIITKSSENKTTKNSEKSVENTETSEFSSAETSPDYKIPIEKEPDRKNEPDPFRGKVKRSYIYVEFEDIDNLEKIIYQYCTSEDDKSVKIAANQIFNEKQERGKITVNNEYYRYIFRYDPPKMKYCIILLDRTLEINTINRLLFIFIIIAGVGLIFIFLISVILANWTIKPVAKAWNQQKEFIANASHELKTPLTVILTNTDVVLSNSEDTVGNQSKWLNYIRNETVRMSKLVNSLLYIAKYDANRIKIIYSKINLSNLVSSICLQYEPLVFENNKTLITDIDDNIEILGDEDKIKQVINILMDNALKYSSNEGTIKLSLKKIKQSSICMTVSNTSEYISKKQLENIFNRFYRIDDSRNRKTGGSGLGLNIAKTIIESHKGTISAVHNDNITSFIITF